MYVDIIVKSSVNCIIVKLKESENHNYNLFFLETNIVLDTQRFIIYHEIIFKNSSKEL